MRLTIPLAFLAVAAVTLGAPRPAEAIIFKDVSAFLQRNAHYLIQFRQLLGAARDTRKTLLSAYAGL
jgi:hypothetical protein